MDWPGVDAGAVRRYLAGDLLAILVFVAIGEVQHAFPPHQYPLRFVGTAVPFLAGWALAAPVVGAYRRSTLTTPLAAAAWALLAWLLADAVGQLLRDTAVFPGGADPIFYVVAAGAGGALLVAWRGVAAAVATGG
jgi:hypothetical protein